MRTVTPATGASGHVALKSATVTVVGGVNQARTSLIVTSNDGTQTLWFAWGDAVNPPDAATVKADGLPILARGGSLTFQAELKTTGSGATNPTLFGVAETSDQTSPADTRWAEQS